MLEEELKPGGKDIELTQSNKDEYIKWGGEEEKEEEWCVIILG